MKVSNLAVISRRSESDLRKIAFFPTVERPRWCSLLGHDLVPTDLSVTGAKFCPTCASDQGFIESHWHLTLMVGCPIHARLLTSTCSGCDQRIRWFRPGILECACGKDLRGETAPTISLAEASLLDVARRKALGLPASPENQASLPQAELLSMSLRTILVVIQVLGKYQLIADGFTERADELQLVVSASRVLADWPSNFYALLQSLGERMTVETNSGIRKQFENIYHALFKNKTIQPPEQTAFLREAFIDFAMDHWGRGVVDSRFLRGLRGGATGRFMTQAAFARKIGVQPRTAAKILKDRGIPSKRVKCGAAFRVLIDLRNVSLPCSSPGTILRCRDAARQLGISPEVLQILKHRGLYSVQHLSPARPGFHTLDVQLFKQGMLALAPSTGLPAISKADGISLGTVFRNPHDSPATKATVIGAILSKEIVVLSNVDGTIGGLLLEATSYQRCLVGARKCLSETRKET